MQTFHVPAAKPRRSTLASGMFQSNRTVPSTSFSPLGLCSVKEAAYIQELPAATPSALAAPSAWVRPAATPSHFCFRVDLVCPSAGRQACAVATALARPKLGMLRPRLGSPIAFPAGASRLWSCLRFLVDGGRPLHPRWLPCSIPTHCNALAVPAK